MKIPLDEILTDDEFNCRGTIDPVSVGELSASIDAEGLLVPVLVMPYAAVWKTDPTWKCIAGHRRIAACRLLKHKEIECNVIEAVDDKTARRKNLQENLGRKDLTPTQEMRAIVAIYGESPDRAAVAEDLGVSRKWLNDRLAILKLSSEIHEKVDEGKLGAIDITYLLIAKPEERWDMAKMLMENKAAGGTSKALARKMKLRSKARGIQEIGRGMDALDDLGISPSWHEAMTWCQGKLDSEEFFQCPIDKMKKYGILE